MKNAGWPTKEVKIVILIRTQRTVQAIKIGNELRSQNGRRMVGKARVMPKSLKEIGVEKRREKIKFTPSKEANMPILAWSKKLKKLNIIKDEYPIDQNTQRIEAIEKRLERIEEQLKITKSKVE